MKPLAHRLPPLQSCVFFEAAARNRSFTKAADELGISQGAVSKQIKALEVHLNVSLFVRNHKGLELTHAGKVLYVEAQTALEKLSSTTESLRADAERNAVSIVASIAVAQYWLFPRIAQFQKTMPGIDISIHSTDAIDETICHQHDLAILFGDGSWTEAFEVNCLFKERIFAVCGPNYEKSAIRAPRDLLKERLLHLAPEDWPWSSWSDWFDSFGLGYKQPPNALLFNNLPLLLTAAKNDAGVALGWEFAVENALKEGTLRKICDFEVTRNSADFLVHSKNRSLSSPAKQLKHWLLDYDS